MPLITRIVSVTMLCSAFTLVPQFVSAADFTIVDGQTETGAPQSLQSGEKGWIMEGGTLDVTDRGILSVGDNVIIINDGTIRTSSDPMDNTIRVPGILSEGVGASITNSGSIIVPEGELAIDGRDGDEYVTLQAGSIINGDINLGGGSNTFTTQGAMTLNDNIINAGVFTSEIELGDEQIFNGVISGADTSLNIKGEGKVILTGNNTYEGDTTITTATLQIGDGMSEFDTSTLGSGDVINNGRLAFNLGDSFFSPGASLTYNGEISGTGDVIQQSGTTYLTGNNTYEGITSISEGASLWVGNGGTTGTLGSGDVINNGELVYHRSDALTYAGNISGSGFLHVNTGPLILTGNNTSTGATTIYRNATLQVGDGGDTGSLGAGNVTNYAKLIFNRTGELEYAGVISGDGTLIKQGTGTVTLTGKTPYTGSTTIAEGTLKISHLSNGGDYINHGVLVFNKETGTGSNMYLNGLSGAGSLIKEGGGVLLLNGDKAYTGNTYINNGFIQAQGKNALGVNGAVTVAENGQLVIWTDLSVGSLAGEGTINLSRKNANQTANTLIVGGDDTSTAFNGIISGDDGGLTKTGEGALTLAGINTYTGSTTVNNGLLEVNGSLASEVTINNGGTLGGRGNLGSVMVNGGRLAPGNSIGTLNTDSVDFSGGGVYEVEVDAAGHTDLLNVSGTATLTGGSVQVIPEDGDYQPSTDYTILKAGTIVGTFDSVSSTLAFLDPTLSYDANNVFLTLNRNDYSFASVAETSNQQAVSQTIDTLSQTQGANIAVLTDNLLLLTAEGAKNAYDNLSGVQHSNAQQLQMRVGQQFRGLLSRRMNAPVNFAMGNELSQLATVADIEVLPPTAAGELNPIRGFWLEGMGGQGDIDGDRNSGGVDYDFYGVAGGLDMEVAQDWVAGAAFGYTRTDADIDNGGLDVDSYMAAVYGAWQPSAFYLNGNLTFGLHSTDASRQVVVGTFSERAESDYDSVSVQAAVEAGQTLQTTAAGFDVTPFVGLEVFTDSRESFTEKGAGIANLDVDRERMESLQSSLGVRLEKTWTTDSGKTLMPMLEVAWAHEYLDETATLNAGFADAPGSRFSVEGPELDRNRARVGAGIAVNLSDASQLTMGYQGEFAGSDDTHMVSARFRMEW